MGTADRYHEEWTAPLKLPLPWSKLLVFLSSFSIAKLRSAAKTSLCDFFSGVTTVIALEGFLAGPDLPSPSSETSISWQNLPNCPIWGGAAPEVCARELGLLVAGAPVAACPKLALQLIVAAD